MPAMAKWLGLAAIGAVGAAAALTFAGGDAPAPAGAVTVYKSPTCGCCADWADHLRESGFTVQEIDVESLAEVKALNGVTDNLASCHTAIVDGYVIEGHVPAEDVRRLLAERPKVAGLAVPGMPIGSPGMEGPNPQPYNVVAFERSGRVTIYARH